MGKRLEGKFRPIELEKLDLDEKSNVRKTDVFQGIEDLARNIQENGLLVPLIVREQIPDTKYLVISGQRRLQACRMINYSPVECIVVKQITTDEGKILSLSENLYRLDMNPDDISDACDYLYKKFDSIADVAKHLGVSEPTVRKYLGYKNVPNEVKELVREKKITASQAIRIYTQFLDLRKQIAVANELAKIQQRVEKSKFFHAIKKSLPTDDVPKIKERYAKLRDMKQYTILLPPKTSEVIEKVAKEMDVEPEYIMAEILEEWIEDRQRKGLSIIA